MAAVPVISMLAARAGLNAILALLNTGGAGSVDIRTGAPEATTLTADSGTLLATLTLSATAFPPSTDGATDGLAHAVANAIGSATAVGAGNAGHFRAKNGSGTVIVQGNCSATPGAADMILNSVAIAVSDLVAATSWTVTLPDGTGSD